MRDFNKDEYKYKMNGKKMPQTERLLKYLKEQGVITRAKAFNLLGIAELSSRVGEINRQKLRIDKCKVSVNTVYAGDVNVMAYFLI
jgi:hypothetical protein